MAIWKKWKVAHAGTKRKLLELKGIGTKTDDSILFYALVNPVFVIDKYTAIS